MLNQLEQAKQRWGGAHHAIDAWLEERRELLVRFCQLAGLPPFENLSSSLPNKQDIESFCQILVDYISAGHFEVYDKISSECQEPDSHTNLSEQLYSKITATTEQALTFHDTYADLDAEQTLDNFDMNLSMLGQQLEERFALEDQLIQHLHLQNA